MKLTLPTGWQEVTLEQFQQIQELAEDLNLTPIDYKLEVISILTGVDTITLSEMEVTSLNMVWGKLEWIKTNPKDKAVEYIAIGAKVFEVCYDVTKLTAGQYIDLSHLLKEPKEAYKHYHEIMAALCKPIKLKWFFGYSTKYEGYAKYANDFKQVTMDKVFPVTAFFLQVWSGLMANMPNYLIETTRKIQEEIMTEIKNS